MILDMLYAIGMGYLLGYVIGKWSKRFKMK